MKTIPGLLGRGWATSLVLMLCGSLTVVAAGAAKPNLILIFADDLGYGDVGCFGAKDIPTPNMDSLARDGVRFTDGYVTAHVCAPSRCGIMSGAYQQRFGMQSNTDRARYKIPETQKLLPEALKAAGYVTGHIGKWNLPRDPRAVFDEVYDLMDWEGDYWPDATGNYTGVNSGIASGKQHGIWGPNKPEDEYLTDRLGRHAVEFVERHSNRPFFLYLAFNAVHSPWHGKKEHQPKVAHIDQEILKLYASMRLSMDENIGRVLAALKQKGLEQNTIVAFTSDNGPAYGNPNIKVWPEGWPKGILAGSAGPLNGHKGQFLEGGIREPFILRWPARLKAGQVYSNPVISMDFYPTFCAAAGVEIPKGTILDGVNLLPYLAGDKGGVPHEVLFWKQGASGAVRQGDWKLFIPPGGGAPQLFNLKDDLGETRDLVGEKRELAAGLLKRWRDWSAPFPAPANPNPNKAKKK